VGDPDSPSTEVLVDKCKSKGTDGRHPERKD
jgi:hypothetical protein